MQLFKRNFLLSRYKILFGFFLLNFFNTNITADSFIYNSYNNHGITGLINLPSARFQPESTGGITFFYGDPDQKITFTSSPYNWMEASVFYTNIKDKEYGSGFKQDYKDKGFNIKLRIKEEGKYPAVAVGINDIAGTGFYSSEYIVASYGIGNIDMHAGMGWGTLNGTEDFKNPLIFLDERFRNRPTEFEDQGGQFQLSRYFSNNKVSNFFGASYALNDRVLLKYEYDTTVDPGLVSYENFSSRNSFSVEYKINKTFRFGISFERENYIGLKFNYKKTANSFKKDISYVQLDENEKKQSDKYEKLVTSLGRNGIGVNKISESKNSIALEVSQFQHPSIEILKEIIAISSEESGIEKNIYTRYKTADLNAYDEIDDELELNAEIIYQRKSTRKLNSKNIINIRPYVASREYFLRWAVMFENNSEYIYSDSLLFSSNLKHAIYSNLDDLYVPAKDTYPEQVRSDVKDYLNNFNNGIIIGRAQFDFHKTLKNHNHIMLTGGILEEMFSGIGFEYLNFNPSNNYAFGFEYFKAAKRDYELKFGHTGYRQDTGFLNFYYRNYNFIPFDAKLSYGKYLAGDKGYTFEIYRKYQNGASFGVFVTKTNVSAEQFGEGSFDKGIYFNFPFTSNNLLNYTWRPLTKDPGAKLNRKHTLHDLLVKFQPFN
jgi:hypothetical protein